MQQSKQPQMSNPTMPWYLNHWVYGPVRQDMIPQWPTTALRGLLRCTLIVTLGNNNNNIEQFAHFLRDLQEIVHKLPQIWEVQAYRQGMLWSNVCFPHYWMVSQWHSIVGQCGPGDQKCRGSSPWHGTERSAFRSGSLSCSGTAHTDRTCRSHWPRNAVVPESPECQTPIPGWHTALQAGMAPYPCLNTASH